MDCGKRNLNLETVRCWDCFVVARREGRAVTNAALYSGKACADCGVAISRRAKGRCKPCGHRALARPIPNDFASMLRTLGSQECAKHYGCSLTRITHWRRQIGLIAHERAIPKRTAKGF